MARINCMGWLFGYFIILAPLNFIYSWDVIPALMHGIIGVAGAIIFLEWKK